MSDVKTKEKVARVVVQKVINGALYSDGSVLVENVRCSYPHVFKPSAFEGGEPSFSIKLLVPKAKSHAAVLALLNKHMDGLCAEAKMKRPPADKLFLRDGDESDKAENENAWTISAREKRRPAVRGPDRAVWGSEDADKMYGGCWVNCLIRPWVQNNQFGKRVNANLIAVQFVRDDEAFGEGRISDAEIDETFGDVEDNDVPF